MGNSQRIPIIYIPGKEHRDMYFMERYGIECNRIMHRIEWAGLDWIVKHSPMLPVGIGNNFYVHFTVQKIFVIMLQLMIQKKFGKWLCAEITSNEEFSFGIFQWEIVCDVQSLDPNIMLTIALVPKDRNRGPPGTCELGIKVSKNLRQGGANLHFGLLPPPANGYKNQSAQRSIKVTTRVEYLTFRIIWMPRFVRFQFQQGAYLQQNKEVLSWQPSAIPQLIPQKPLKIRMGLSLLNGAMGTANQQDAEVLIKGFSYRPFEIAD